MIFNKKRKVHIQQSDILIMNEKTGWWCDVISEDSMCMVAESPAIKYYF